MAPRGTPVKAGERSSGSLWFFAVAKTSFSPETPQFCPRTQDVEKVLQAPNHRGKRLRTPLPNGQCPYGSASAGRKNEQILSVKNIFWRLGKPVLKCVVPIYGSVSGGQEK